MLKDSLKEVELTTATRLILLKDELFRTWGRDRKAELRREIAILEEQLEAERRAIEARQGELF